MGGIVRFEEKIKISARGCIPETGLYVKRVQKKYSQDIKTVLSDDVAILCVPGGPGGNHSVFDAILEELSLYANLILFDPRGCGYSDESDPKFCTLEHYIDDIETVRQYFSINRLILLGGSYGAMAAMGYAIKYPHFLEKLVLLAGAPNGSFIEQAKKNLEKIGTNEQKKAAETLWSGAFTNAADFSEFYKKMANLYSVSSQTETPPVIQSGIPYNISVLNLGFKTFLRTFDFDSLLEKILCPVLLVCGAQDWINDPQYAIFSAQKIPKAKLCIFDQCGHFVWKDQPRLFFSAVKEFLNGTTALKNEM